MTARFCSGKVAIFVANQANMTSVPKEECDAFEKEWKEKEERKKALTVEVKSAAAGIYTLTRPCALRQVPYV
jgi:hypothetical protein